MQRYPIWRIKHPEGYPSLIQVLLQNRSLSPDDLSDSPEVLNDPFLMQDMAGAVACIGEAIRAGKRIAVYGDYDADGVTSSALLLDFLDHVGADSVCLLPDRFRDGYGMKPPGVERAVKQGAQLIVTADNGISSFEAVEVAKQAGLDVVVIDHHHPQDQLPAARALVNPNRPDCAYPFKGLAAVGVAFKVVQALAGDQIPESGRRRYLNSLLDLVALGTVSDLAPMIGENRLLTRRGMQLMDQNPRPGIQALKEVVGAADRPVDTTAIGFFLGPRINCAGRLASADLALNLLRSKNESEAGRLARDLNALNRERQELQSAGMAEAEREAETQALSNQKILVIQGEDWHLGVVGLIAGRLVEKYWRPCLVCTNYRKNGVFTGSARTAGGYNIVEAIFRVADLLTEYGGHADAAGFSLPAENLPTFRERLITDASDRLKDDDLIPQLELDVTLAPEDISLKTVEELDQLAPFGAGNESPRFLVRGCRIQSVRAVGQGAHLKLTVDTGAGPCDTIWWRQGDRLYELNSGTEVDVAFQLGVNTWKGRTSVQMMVEDMRLAEAATH